MERRLGFSFGEFHDPKWMGFGPLRVLNEDRYAPGAGLPVQRRANMELVEIVLAGRLACADGVGGEQVLEAGDVRWTGAGHGIEHATRNPDANAPALALQAWLQPERLNAAPRCAQRQFDLHAARGAWRTLLSPDGAGESIPIRLQAWLRTARLPAGESVAVDLDPQRRYWLQVTAGAVEAGGHRLAAGDALALEREAGGLAVRAIAANADVLLFDLPG